MFCNCLYEKHCQLNCRKGKQAIPKIHSKLIKFSNERNIKGSVNLDEDLKKHYPEANRWDYLVAYSLEIGKNAVKSKIFKNFLLFFEVHNLNSKSEIKLILKKKEFIDWWIENTPDCNQGFNCFSKQKLFFCIPTSGVESKRSAMALAKKGIKVYKKHSLIDNHLSDYLSS